MRKAEVFSPARWLTAGVVAAGMLSGVAGCGSTDKPAAAVSPSSAKARKEHKPSQPLKAGEENPADMVAAVSATKTGPPVELKFTLSHRPEVGQVLDVNVAVIPQVLVPGSVGVTFQVTDGLDIVDGAQLPKVDKVAYGEPLRHVVRILPKRDGIFTLTAVVSLGEASQDSNRTFSIPVIAGEGLSEQAAKGP